MSTSDRADTGDEIEPIGKIEEEKEGENIIWAEAIFDFTLEDDEDLHYLVLNPGDRVKVISQEDPEWYIFAATPVASLSAFISVGAAAGVVLSVCTSCRWFGELNGDRGFFPSNHTKEISSK
jgi:hypothetical protein